MRIIGGEYKGRLIHPPSFFKARPTTDLAKESLFNILNNRIDFDGIRVLDLFSGTGSISYEFASRGAELVVCVEQNNKYARFIQKTADSFNMNSIHVFNMDAFKYITKQPQGFDFIFADPPYDLPTLGDVPDIVIDNQLLNDGGLFVFEHSEKYSFQNHSHFVEMRRYGRVHFSFFG